MEVIQFFWLAKQTGTVTAEDVAHLQDRPDKAYAPRYSNDGQWESFEAREQRPGTYNPDMDSWNWQAGAFAIVKGTVPDRVHVLRKEWLDNDTTIIAYDDDTDLGGLDVRFIEYNQLASYREDVISREDNVLRSALGAITDWLRWF